MSEIPVERATALSFAINLKTAEQLGLSSPSQCSLGRTGWLIEMRSDDPAHAPSPRE